MKWLNYSPLEHSPEAAVTTTVELPVGARVVDVLMRAGKVTLLSEAPTVREGTEQRDFTVACCRPGDGITDFVNHNIPSDAQYIGTVGLHVDWLFCHVFEVEAL